MSSRAFDVAPGRRRRTEHEPFGLALSPHAAGQPPPAARPRGRALPDGDGVPGRGPPASRSARARRGEQGRRDLPSVDRMEREALPAAAPAGARLRPLRLRRHLRLDERHGRHPRVRGARAEPLPVPRPLVRAAPPAPPRALDVSVQLSRGGEVSPSGRRDLRLDRRARHLHGPRRPSRPAQPRASAGRGGRAGQRVAYAAQARRRAPNGCPLPPQRGRGGALHGRGRARSGRPGRPAPAARRQAHRRILRSAGPLVRLRAAREGRPPPPGLELPSHRARL